VAELNLAAALKALTAVVLALFARQLPVLSPAQHAALDVGRAVVTTEQRPASAWPAVTVYAFIDATPEQAAAIFTDVEAHTTYIESVSKSRISRVIDSATIEVDYTLKVPVVSDEEYTVRDHISRSGHHYRVDWTLVRASSTKATVGHALFMPYTNARTGRAGTLLEYFNFVTPGSRLAGIPFVRSRASAEVRATTESIVRRVKTARGTATMTQRVTELRRLVGLPR
jgi:hypothetical protein